MNTVWITERINDLVRRRTNILNAPISRQSLADLRRNTEMLSTLTGFPVGDIPEIYDFKKED